ncbi:MAG TPA: pentapeptide repeat-containing protein, partial [Candidatus Handelsmanbacteria bacterium]|nr:pentapeptide repeat-containing protein [Candidatus Handelsmanbacteria bacterium]
LVEANLEGADLAGADLTGAIPDKDTTWPEGFDPATSPLAVHPRSD